MAKTESVTEKQREEAPNGELTDTHPPEMDEIFGILQNSRRRLILRYLEDEPSTTIGELAEHIAALENDVSESELRSAQRKRVYVSLYQSHLPKLDETGAISFNRDRGTVEATPDMNEFLRTLDQFEAPVRNSTHSRARYTLAGAALSAAVLTVGLAIVSTAGSWFSLIVATILVGSAVMFLAVGDENLRTN